MRAYEGWLIAKDEKSKKMVPFFPHVRSEDIVNTGLIVPDKVVTQTSKRWTQDRMFDSLDVTYYDFSQSYDNERESDPNAEVITTTYMNAHLQYAFFKSGMVEVNGIIRLGGSEIDFGIEAMMREKKIYLPYACDWTEVSTTYGFGTIDGLSIVGSIKEDIIYNQSLNPGNRDTTQYPYLLDIAQICENDSNTNRLKKLKDVVDPDYKDNDYTTYVNKYLPIRVHLKGRWN